MNSALVDRLAAHRALRNVPRAELEWLAANGRLDGAAAGERIIKPGDPVDEMMVVLSGHVVFYSDRSGTRRRIFEWVGGELAGVLPYSRLRTAPGEAIAEEALEFLAVHRDRFPEMTRECPHVTAACVHSMLDRARVFTQSDLHDEKMASLGKLAAGLAHELNNPASAAARSAKLLHAALSDLEAAVAAVGQGEAGDEEKDTGATALARARTEALGNGQPVARPALEQADREDAFADWLGRRGANPEPAGDLARTGLSLETLEDLASALSAPRLDAALRWIAATCTVHELATEIEHAATRIHDLVSAVKRFTYMDRAAAPEPVTIPQGIHDSVAVLAAKAREKAIAVAVDLPAELPAVLGFGGELNQVWSNLLDNAFDAASLRVLVTARADDQFVTVSVVDDGEGIPDGIAGRVFDPFFTTKPVGQGTGLGLDIVRRIVQRHDGDVSVRSQPGRTEFSVTLPAAGARRATP